MSEDICGWNAPLSENIQRADFQQQHMFSYSVVLNWLDTFL